MIVREIRAHVPSEDVQLREKLINTVAVMSIDREETAFDAIVIGSGISGGWAAKELCEKGLSTLVLERGRKMEHITDYPKETEAWQMPHRGQMTRDQRGRRSQSQGYALTESNQDFFADDLEQPFDQVKPYTWVRGNQVGGRSLMWGRQTYRFSDLDFEANASDGHGVDWPIRYRDIAPWYSYVEKFVGVSGSMEGLPQLPDGEFLPPMELNVLEKLMAVSISKAFPERRLIIGRVANLTQAIHGRGPCQFRDRCHFGCAFAGYFSSNSATLPAAAATGRLTLRPDSVVTCILYDKESRRASGVRVVDAHTQEVRDYRARVIFLNASTLATAQILLNSVSEQFPNGLGNSSDQVGRNVMDHHCGQGVFARLERHGDRTTFGRRPNGFYIPRFRNLGDTTRRKEFLRGYGIQGSANRWFDNPLEGVGAAFKEKLRVAGPWSVWMHTFGEVLPHEQNRVTLNRSKPDKWGVPRLKVDCEYRENELAMMKDIIATRQELISCIGATEEISWDEVSAPGASIHEMGTARMGRDPRTSVLNSWNQMHDVKNVFITDGSCMTSSGCQNPSLTYMALTARACNYAVEELKRGNL